jgi:hypothetical protein
MIQQSEGLQYHPRLMLIDDADRPGQAVLRPQGRSACVEKDRRALGASDERSGDAPLAILEWPAAYSAESK